MWDIEQSLNKISKYDLRSDQILKTGEELPTAIKRLLGEENNLKSSVLQTTSHAITQATNKKMIDRTPRARSSDNCVAAARGICLASVIRGWRRRLRSLLVDAVHPAARTSARGSSHKD